MRRTAFIIFAVVVPLLAWGGFFAYRRLRDHEPPPSIAVEADKQAKLEAAYTASASVGPVEDAEVEDFVRRIGAAVRGGSDEELLALLDLGLMFDAAQTAAGIEVPGPVRAAMVKGLESGARGLFDATAVQTDIKRIERQPSGDIVVYLRTIDPERVVVKTRWWLRSDGTQLKLWDTEELLLGMRLSTILSATIAAADTSKGRDPQLRKIAETMATVGAADFADPDQLAVAAAQLDALAIDGAPESWQRLVLFMRAMVATSLGEMTAGERHLDALEARGLDELEFPARHFQRATLHIQGKRWQPAAEAAQRFLDLLGDDAEAYLLLGIARRSLDDTPGAIAAFDRGIADDPHNGDNYGAIAWATYEPATIAERLRKAPSPEVLDDAVAWLVESEDPDGLAALLAAAPQAVQEWDGPKRHADALARLRAAAAP